MNEEFAATVTSFSLFKDYTIDGAKRILNAGKIRVVSAGEVILKEGDPATFVLLVLKGKLQVYVEREGKNLMLTEVGPSEILGELSVLCGIPRSASVRVLEESTLLEWTAADFRGLLVKDVFLSERIFRYSLRTLIEKERTLIDSLNESKDAFSQSEQST